MKRLHLHFKTDDLQRSIKYYNALFGSEPTQIEADYAKWLLDDPRAHISVSTHGGQPGLDHAGISIDTPEELYETAQRVKEIGAGAQPEMATTCCYAKSNKYWLKDPQSLTWELFQTYGQIDSYGEEPDRALMAGLAAAENSNTPTPKKAQTGTSCCGG